MIDRLLCLQGVLGHSATALVDKVRCKRITLARKRIRCSYKVKREDMIAEVAHLQRLTHAHIIRGIGTYVIKKELSILLYPATAYNLETFMEEYDGLQERQGVGGVLPEDTQMIRRRLEAIPQFFKCLASTVAFIHSQCIKHMDIKPTNILVEQRATKSNSQKLLRPENMRYKLYLADFGISRSYNTAADAETDSFTPFSRIYAAPEVVRQDKRGFAADVFSLGCVFLEMHTYATTGRRALLDLREQNPSRDKSYHSNLLAISTMDLEILPISGIDHVPVIRKMLSFDASVRPTALELELAYGGVSSCCIAGPEPFSVSQDTEFGDVTLQTAGKEDTVLESVAEQR